MGHSSVQAHFEAGGRLCAYVGEWSRVGEQATGHRVCGRCNGQTGDSPASQARISFHVTFARLSRVQAV